MARELETRILIIDDDPSAADCIQRAVRDQQDTRLLVAKHGLTGIDLFQRHHQELSLIVLDMRLPDIDGPTICAAIRHQDKQTPIMPFTAYLGETSVLDALGCTPVLQKPASIPEIRQALQDALSGQTAVPPASPLLRFAEHTAARMIELQRATMPPAPAGSQVVRKRDRKVAIVQVLHESGPLSAREIRLLLPFIVPLSAVRQDLYQLVEEGALATRGNTNQLKYYCAPPTSEPQKL